MTYELTLSASASSYIRRQPRDIQRRIARRLDQLREDPLDLAHSKPLKSRRGQRSSRIGNLRIIFTVEDVIRLVSVSEIGPRGDIYRS